MHTITRAHTHNTDTQFRYCNQNAKEKSEQKNKTIQIYAEMTLPKQHCHHKGYLQHYPLSVLQILSFKKSAGKNSNIKRSVGK